ncbi:MAG: EAL domain-containing protein [Eubacterium sp.]
MDHKSLLNALEEIIYVVNPKTYELLYLNQTGLDALDIEGSYYGLPCYKVLQGQDQPCSYCTNDKLNDKEFYVWEHNNTNIDRHYLLKDKNIVWYDIPAKMEIAIDITEKEDISQRIKEKLKIEETIVDCIKTLTTETNMDKAIDSVLMAIGQFYSSDRAYIFELTSDRQHVNNTYEWCAEGIIPEIDVLQNVEFEVVTQWFNYFNQDKVVSIQNIEDIKYDDPLVYKTLKPQKINSVIVVPLKLNQTILGFIGVDNPLHFDKDMELLSSMSYFIIEDIEKRRTRDQLKVMSYTDGLTGLANRNWYNNYLSTTELSTFSSIGIVFIDINGLKTLNDRYGHLFGDEAIISLSNLIQRCFSTAQIFRLGGDEFVIICENIDAQSFEFKIEYFLKLASTEKNYSVSVGHVWSDQHTPFQKLLSRADELMYIDKQNYYKAKDIPLPRHQNARILSELLDSIENNEFIVYLQPKIDTQTEVLIGAEALVRHLHPKYGMISPDQFIPLLEREKIIKFIDFFVFEQMCQLCEKWQQLGYKITPISINFSRVTLIEPDFVDSILRIKNKYDFPRNCLELEITESVDNLDRERLIKLADKIKCCGFNLSLDDFGAKYTNLSLLTSLNVDVLKFDKSLIDNLVFNERNQIIMEALITTCQRVGIKSIAEGVETQEQLEVLKNLQCNYVQGYLFSKPITIDTFERLYLKQ